MRSSRTPPASRTSPSRMAASRHRRCRGKRRRQDPGGSEVFASLSRGRFATTGRSVRRSTVSRCTRPREPGHSAQKLGPRTVGATSTRRRMALGVFGFPITTLGDGWLRRDPRAPLACRGEHPGVLDGVIRRAYSLPQRAYSLPQGREARSTWPCSASSMPMWRREAARTSKGGWAGEGWDRGGPYFSRRSLRFKSCHNG